MKRLPRARPISVRLAWRASSTPQAVKPEREIRIGMPMVTVLMTISLVSRPVVYMILPEGPMPFWNM